MGRQMDRWRWSWTAVWLLLAAVMAGGGAQAATPDISISCPLSDPPSDAGGFSGAPGNWFNPKRIGTGWSLNFIGPTDDQSLLVYWHTFDPQSRRPVWLISDIGKIELGNDGVRRWRSPLYRTKYNLQTGTKTQTTVGEVQMAFAHGSATSASIAWKWDRVDGAFHEECVYDIYRATGTSGAGSPAAKESTMTQAYTSNWYDRRTSGWGIDVNVGVTWTRVYAEQSIFDVYDNDGNPAWAESAWTSTAGLPSAAWRDHPVRHYKANYRITDDCSSASICLGVTTLPATGSQFGRAYASEWAGVTDLRIVVPAAANEPGIAWPPTSWTPVPPAEMPLCPPGRLCRPIERLTNHDIVMVSQTHCDVPPGASVCPVDVSWVSSHADAKVYRVDASSLQESQPAFGDYHHGQRTDLLAPGARVFYRLRTPNHPLSTSAIVTATALGGPATPPAPFAPQVPKEDMVSTSVGFTGGAFRVDESGSATYSVPLQVPAGRGGVTPQLSLNYHGSSGDGHLGMGGHIGGVGAITRCRLTAEAGDADPGMGFVPGSYGLCLNGQRLVRVGGGADGRDTAEYRTEIDSFQKIVIVGEEAAGSGSQGSQYIQPVSFVVYGKDGTVSRYGTGSSRRKYVPGAAGDSGLYTAEWWLSTVDDTFGNRIEFHYAGVSAIGALALDRVNWVGGGVKFHYTLRPQPVIGYASGSLLAVDRWLDRVEVLGAAGTPLRQYGLQYEAMPLNAAQKRLSAVVECNGAGSACLAPTVFAWNGAISAQGAQALQKDGTNNFRDIRAFKHADVDGDGRADLVWVNKSQELFVTLSRPTPAGIDFATQAYVATINCEMAGSECAEPAKGGYSATWAVLDYNGDGRDDLLIYQPGGWQIWRSDGQTFVNSGLVVPNSGSSGSAIPRAILADYTGDGLPDLITHYAGFGSVQAWVLKPATGGKSAYRFDGPYPVDTLGGSLCSVGWLAQFHGERSQAVDLNQDGASDLVVPVPRSACGTAADKDVALLYTSRGVLNGKLTFQRLPQPMQVPGVTGALQMADINADGAYDVLWRDGNNVLYYNLNQGRHLDPTKGLFDPALARCAVPACQSVSSWNDVRLFDYDGDGRLDLWLQNTSRDYYVHLWNDAGFAAQQLPTFFHGGTNSDEWLRSFADLDGDGHLDNLIMRHTSNGASWQTKRAADRYQPRNVLKSVGHGLGGMTLIDYAPLTFNTVYKRSYDSEGGALASGRGAPVQSVTAPRFVVSGVRSSAPLETDPAALSQVRYRYEGLRVQGGGRGSLGFQRVYTYDVTNLLSTTTEYYQNYPLTGLAKSTQVHRAFWGAGACPGTPDSPGCMSWGGWNGNGSIGVVLTRQSDTWEYRTPGGGQNPNLAAVPREPIFVHRTRAETLKNDFVAGLLSAEITDFSQYDGNGNLVSSTSRHFDDAAFSQEIRRVTTTQVYSDDPVRWFLGRLTRSTVTTTRPNLPAVTRVSAFTYDAATGVMNSEQVQPEGSAAEALTTYYRHDPYGNRVASVVCSKAAGAACHKDLAAAQLTYAPTDPLWVQRLSRTTFDANGLYPQMQHGVFRGGEVAVSTVMARDAYGTPTQVRDVNGVDTVSGTDGFGRMYYTGTATGGSSVVSQRWCSTDGTGTSLRPYCPQQNGQSAAVFRVETRPAGAPRAFSYFDRLGREILTLRQSFAPGEYTAVRKTYDAAGRLYRVSEPYFARAPAFADVGEPVNGATIHWTMTEYDYLGRAVRVVAPNGAETTITFNGLQTVTTLPLNQANVRETKTTLQNRLGETVKAIDHLGSSVTFGYDTVGNAVSATRLTYDGKTATGTTQYDGLGRKTQLQDPDAGVRYFAYNAAGETIQQRSDTSCTRTRYDARGRALERTDHADGGCATAAETTTTWTYDSSNYGVGQLGVVNHTDKGKTSSRTHRYDGFGRNVEVENIVVGRTYIQQSTFDAYGRPFQNFFSGTGIPKTGELFQYTAEGYQVRVRNAYSGTAGPVYYEVLAMDARGNVTGERRADTMTLHTTRQYDPATGRLRAISTNNNTIQALSYDYDPIGNLLWREDRSDGIAQYEQFAYDGLQRLTKGERREANGGFAPTFGGVYDGLGNLGSATFGTRAPLCGTGPAPGPGAISISGTSQFCYDTRGNHTKQFVNNVEQRVIEYSAYDLPRRTSGRFAGAGTTRFTYGPERQRLQRTEYSDYEGNPAYEGPVTTFVGDAEIVVTLSTGAIELRRYISGLILTQFISNNVVAETQYRYLLTDALGSTHRIADENGYLYNAGGKQAYTPFGARADAATGVMLPADQRYGFDTRLTRHGYTGHEQVDRSGIVHMNGRVYDPALGRFLQADPIVQDPSNVQNLNRYTYVLNNPLAHTDPTGYWGKQQQGYLRTAAAIAITVATAGAAGPAAGGALTYTQLGIYAIGGFTAGAIGTGNLRGAVMGAFTSIIAPGIDSAFSGASSTSQLLSRAAAGGFMEQLNGGSFGHGFVRAGVAATLSPHIDTGSAFTDGILHAVVGGTASELSGGKFVNGAASVALARTVGCVTGRATTAARRQALEERMAAFAYGEKEYWIAWEPPALPQWLVDAAAGLGDGVSLGLTSNARDCLGIDGGVDTSSITYNSTYVAGIPIGLAAGGAGFNMALRPSMLYHFTSARSAAAIYESGMIMESAAGIRGIYGTGVYATAFNSAGWATLSGAASTEAVVAFSTQGLRVVPTFWPGTFRVLGGVRIP